MNRCLEGLLNELVEVEGMEVTMRRMSSEAVARLTGRESAVVYDLNTATKSSVYLLPLEDGRVFALGRYMECDEVDELRDLAFLFARRYLAKGFGSSEWCELAVKYGAMEKSVRTVTEYTA